MKAEKFPAPAWRARKTKSEITFDEAIARSYESSAAIESPINQYIFYGAVFGAILLAFVAIWKIGELGLAKADFYTRKAESNINKEVAVVAPRGIITDRLGNPLVENELAFSAFLNIRDMVKNGEKEKVLSTLQEILGSDPVEITQKLDQADLENVNEVKIAEGVSREETVKLAGSGLSSVYVSNDYKRKYLDPAFAHIIGYVGLPRKEDLLNNRKLNLVDVIGREGLEAYYNSELQGVDGEQIAHKNAKGQLKGVESTGDPIPGKNLKTTIDAELQKYFYDRLVYNTNLRGQKAAAGIALNPKTGEILSLVSLPSYDANNIGKYLNAPSSPLFNRAISGVYNPGSTIKPLHAVAGLHEGVITPNTEIYSRGFIEVPNPYAPDKPSRYVDHFCCGWVDLHSALAVSSNVFFYANGGGLPLTEADIVKGGEKITGVGIDRLNKYWDVFGFNKSSQIDLPGESKAVLPTVASKEKKGGDNIWRVGDTYNVSIGQGDLAVNMIQLADYFAAIANKGKVYKPHFLADEAPQLLMDLSEYTPEFKEVEKGMEDSIYKSYGTSYSMHDVSMKIAGKTGTAQTNQNTRTNALFVGYGSTDAPDGPNIEVLVLIENAREGSLNAIPVAKDVFEWYHQNRLLATRLDSPPLARRASQ